jgi:hypothetical protein
LGWQDEAWKEQAQQNGGPLLSIDGIQPDKGNDLIDANRSQHRVLAQAG